MNAALLLDPSRWRMPAFFERLTLRERRLLLLVGGAIFLVVNFALIRGLLVTLKNLNMQKQAKTVLLNTQRTLLEEAEMWKARDAWLKQKQPAMTKSRDLANVDLLNDLEKATRDNGLLLENPPVINPPENAPSGAPYKSVSVSIDTKGTWNALVRFLHTVQQPENFVVFESATIQSDPTDAALLRGKFRVAKWYQP